MATMTPENHPNNVRFIELVSQSGLSLPVAITLLNRGRSSALTESVVKAWIAPAGSAKWQVISDEDLQRAQLALS